MMFTLGEQRLALVTTHIPLAEVASAITKENLTSTITLVNDALKDTFGVTNPKLLVTGLNPHAGENGHLGREEIDIISPTLETLRKQAINLVGPVSADTVFKSENFNSSDAVISMYHDQSLPVFKTLGFGKIVNTTLGLPFIRTSVDHGTALDLAGTDQADEYSLKEAIELAIKLSTKP